MMKKLPLLLLASAAFLNAAAQKLPKIQTTAMRAPANIKIDGKTTEWDDKFQAYNSGQHIYYTISNDDNNLYLTVKMADIIGSKKIFRGGLTFSVIPSSANTGKLAITFPFISFNRKNDLGDGADGGPLTRYAGLASNKIITQTELEAALASINNKIKNYKEVHVKGLPGTTDPLLSIYNTQDITIGASIDKNMRYVYEMAIPLKHFNNTKTFKYNILLRADATEEGKRIAVQPSRLAGPEPQLAVARRLRPPDADELFLDNDTDFSGEYTLAK